MKFPFAEHIGLRIDQTGDGRSVLSLEVAAHHLNSSGVVHGAVFFALADTGMGAALYSRLERSQRAATIEARINYFRPVREGRLVCTSEVVHQGRTVGAMESSVHCDGRLVARASGTFSIFAREPAAGPAT